MTTATLATGMTPRSIPTAVASRAAIRVLHLINGEHYAGAERVQDLLAQRMPEQGFEVDFACVKPKKFPKTCRAEDSLMFAVPMKSRFDLLAAGRVARLLQRHGHAILHTHTPRTAMIGRVASVLSGVPMVHHVHGQTATEVRGWRHRLSAFTERLSLWRVSRVIAVSESSGDYMWRQGVADGAITVVPNGIPAGPLPVRPAPHGTWTLGTVGLFRPRKGLEVLLRAMARLKWQGRQVRLRAVGPFETPEYETEIQQLAADLDLADDVEWRGFRRDVPAELANMDLFVFPSVLPEGMPMVVLEAMATGVPVVGTRVAGVTDAIRDGRDGLLTRPGDHEDLARAVAQIMRGSTSWQALRTSAHSRQNIKFSDRSMAAGVATVYRQVLANRVNG